MPGHKRTDKQTGSADDGDERGVTLEGQDDAPPPGYRSTHDEVIEEVEDDFLWEDGDPVDRRRDPLRKP